MGEQASPHTTCNSFPRRVETKEWEVPSHPVQSFLFPVFSAAQKRYIVGLNAGTFGKHLGKGRGLTCARGERGKGPSSAD